MKKTSVLSLVICLGLEGTAFGQTSVDKLLKEKTKVLAKTLKTGLDSLPADDQGSYELAGLVKNLKRVGFGVASGNDRWAKWQAGKDVEFLSKLDKDQDKKVSKAELESRVEESLKSNLKSRTDLDRDNDGRISKKEYAVSQRPKFGKFDSDGLDGHGRSHFRREDTDKDGYISLTTETFPRYFKRELSAALRIQVCLRISKLSDQNKTKISQSDFEKLFKTNADKSQLKSLWTKFTKPSKKDEEQIDSVAIKNISSQVSRLDSKTLEFVSNNLK